MGERLWGTVSNRSWGMGNRQWVRCRERVRVLPATESRKNKYNHT